jgi:hypothetical protein
LEAAPRLPPVTAEPANRMFEPPKPDDVTAETWARLVVVNRPTSRRTSATSLSGPSSREQRP